MIRNGSKNCQWGWWRQWQSRHGAGFRKSVSPWWGRKLNIFWYHFVNFTCNFIRERSQYAKRSFPHIIRDVREWLFTFPFPPIPMQSISIPSHSHSQFCDYSHSHSRTVDQNIMNLLAIMWKRLSLLKTAIPELCRFCFIRSCSVSIKKHYRKKG